MCMLLATNHDMRGVLEGISGLEGDDRILLSILHLHWEMGGLTVCAPFVVRLSYRTIHTSS